MSSKKPKTKSTSDFAPLASSTVYGSRLQLDLDFTKISTSDSSERNNIRKLDYAYNEYLQALAKKRIISTSIQQYLTLLQQQIDYQNHEIIKMRNECQKKRIVLDDALRNNEMLKTLKELEEQFKKFEESEGCRNINHLTNFSNILGAACREHKLVGVKHLSNIDEWLSLLKIMNESCKFLHSCFKSHQLIKEFELIDEISKTFKETLELQTYIQEQITISSSFSNILSCKYLDKMKNLFEVLERAK